MSNNKQSSVEWLYQEFERIDKEFHVGTYEYNYAKNLAFKIAKAMHKEEIINAWRQGDGVYDKVSKEMSVQYYKQKFNYEME